uniref:TIR domain containing adaptor molecule 1 n=1 Tax=Panthera leo TaxID=9689 RepID=A0A8C8WSN9_PANLE
MARTGPSLSGAFDILGAAGQDKLLYLKHKLKTVHQGCRGADLLYAMVLLKLGQETEARISLEALRADAVARLVARRWAGVDSAEAPEEPPDLSWAIARVYHLLAEEKLCPAPMRDLAYQTALQTFSSRDDHRLAELQGEARDRCGWGVIRAPGSFQPLRSDRGCLPPCSVSPSGTRSLPKPIEGLSGWSRGCSLRSTSSPASLASNLEISQSPTMPLLSQHRGCRAPSKLCEEPRAGPGPEPAPTGCQEPEEVSWPPSEEAVNPSPGDTAGPPSGVTAGPLLGESAGPSSEGPSLEGPSSGETAGPQMPPDSPGPRLPEVVPDASPTGQPDAPKALESGTRYPVECSHALAAPASLPLPPKTTCPDKDQTPLSLPVEDTASQRTPPRPPHPLGPEDLRALPFSIHPSFRLPRRLESVPPAPRAGARAEILQLCDPARGGRRGHCPAGPREAGEPGRPRWRHLLRGFPGARARPPALPAGRHRPLSLHPPAADPQLRLPPGPAPGGPVPDEQPHAARVPGLRDPLPAPGELAGAAQPAHLQPAHQPGVAGRALPYLRQEGGQHLQAAEAASPQGPLEEGAGRPRPAGAAPAAGGRAAARLGAERRLLGLFPEPLGLAGADGGAPGGLREPHALWDSGAPGSAPALSLLAGPPAAGARAPVAGRRPGTRARLPAAPGAPSEPGAAAPHHPPRADGAAGPQQPHVEPERDPGARGQDARRGVTGDPGLGDARTVPGAGGGARRRLQPSGHRGGDLRVSGNRAKWAPATFWRAKRGGCGAELVVAFADSHPGGGGEWAGGCGKCVSTLINIY